jgi:hypothetical protein
MILDFQSNSLTTVNMLKPNLWQVLTRIDGTMFSAEIEIHVKAPALDIRHARLQVSRDVLGLVPDLEQAAENLIGLRVGPGMTKIVRSVMGETQGAGRMADLVLETMEMLVNALTVPELKKAIETGGVFPPKETGQRISLNNVLIGEDTIKKMALNPRLKNSCAAFKGM